MRPAITSLDHLVLTVADIGRTLAFYRDALGMEPTAYPTAAGTRHALSFGTQKINLHQAGAEFAPHAARPAAGSGDLCFLSDLPLEDWSAHLSRHAVPVESGPVRRTGAGGPILSIYIRDPDGNLLEIANRLPE